MDRVITKGRLLTTGEVVNGGINGIFVFVFVLG